MDLHTITVQTTAHMVLHSDWFC